jgi:hypothetical protein
VEVHRSGQNTLSQEPIATEAFHDAAAVVRLTEIYEHNTEFPRRHFAAYLIGKRPAGRVRACYPFVRITTGTFAWADSRLSYGFVSGPGIHETTATRPDLFRCYFMEQIGLLLDNHGVPVEIGQSHEPIPVHFAYRRVPYGTLLCVSDKPLHGEIKLAGMAGQFYRQRIDQHLEIGLNALGKLKLLEGGRLHSRKLRSFTEVAFQ